MWSAVGILRFFPLLLLKLLALLQTSCVDFGLSACYCVAEPVQSIAGSCRAMWCCMYTVTTWPFMLFADTVQSSKSRVSSFVKTAKSSWVARIIHVVTSAVATPFTCLCAKVCQISSEHFRWCRNFPSRLRVSLRKAFLNIAKRALKWLWSCSFEFCTTLHAWVLVLLSGPSKASPTKSQVLLLLPHTMARFCDELSRRLCCYCT